MFKQSMPWVRLKNKQHIDLFFEFLDLESQKKLFKDLKDGHTIKVPNFGGRITNTTETLKWEDLDDVEKEKIEKVLSGKSKNPSLTYDAQSHSYEMKKAHSVVLSFLKISRTKVLK
jgi:hypothetical protein